MVMEEPTINEAMHASGERRELDVYPRWHKLQVSVTRPGHLLLIVKLYHTSILAM